MLLSKRAIVDTKAVVGTPKWFASKYGHTRVVDLLLRNNASIDSVSTNGMSPLCKAGLSGHIETTKLLLSRGAKVDLTTVQENGTIGRPLT